MAGSEPLKLGVLIGGGGRTLLNLADHIDRGALHAQVSVVIATRENLAGVRRARDRALPLEVLEAKEDPETALWEMLREHSVDLVCLGGYMRYLSIPGDFQGRVINIHPALLPSFGGRGMYGMRVHRAVLEHGCKVSGCTVHFVDELYDNGPILLQKTCEVLEDDTAETLAARVFELECEAYPQAVSLIAAGRVRIEGRIARIR